MAVLERAVTPVGRQRDEATLSTNAEETAQEHPEAENGERGPEIDLSKVGGALVRDDEDYEAMATRDAIRRAQDAELEALANLAIFRNNPDARNTMMSHLEWDRFLNPLSPKEVGRHLREGDGSGKSGK